MNDPIDIKIFRQDGAYELVKASDDVGYDIKAIRDVHIGQNKVTKIATGIHLEIPRGVVGFVKNKSSVGINGLTKTAQVIDPSYRGEIHVCLNYNGQDGYFHEFEAGQKIAQIVFCPYYDVNFVEVDSLNDMTTTDRNDGGFGSTGKF